MKRILRWMKDWWPSDTSILVMAVLYLIMVIDAKRLTPGRMTFFVTMMGIGSVGVVVRIVDWYMNGRKR